MSTAPYIYIISESTDGPVKIGFSANPDRRLKQLQTGHSGALTVQYKHEVLAENVKALERIIHRTLAHKRSRGEWFTISTEDAILEVKHAVMRYGDIENLSARAKSRTI